MAAARSLASGLARGVVAGFVGTAAMTGYQYAVAVVRGQPLRTPVPKSWDEAPAPARLAKKAAAAFGQGGRLRVEQAPLLTNLVHWSTGVGWGAVYGVASTALGGETHPVGGVVFGLVVCGSSYLTLVPLGIYEPPWRYSPPTIALDLSYHLVYGPSVAGAYRALER
jgi:hypothetical protein